MVWCFLELAGRTVDPLVAPLISHARFRITQRFSALLGGVWWHNLVQVSVRARIQQQVLGSRRRRLHLVVVVLLIFHE